MLDFNEDLLQFIWQHRLLKPLPLQTSSGKSISIIDTGELNRHSGPDFSNGRIRLDDLTLAGNIEIHKRSSDWLKHKHQNDPAYDHIILHVVYENDKRIPQNTEHAVEVLEIKSLIDEATLQRYQILAASPTKLACSASLASVSDLHFIAWMERMTIERLESKTQRIKSYFENFRGDFAQTFYTLLLRNMGFSTNAEPFELLARNLPIALLFKHADQLPQLEALLLGTAGWLELQYQDEYIRYLQNEFSFLSQKYNLVPLRKTLFKQSRMRPANFPVLRLAQLAQLIHSNSRLFFAPHQYSGYDLADAALSIQLKEYWLNHYQVDGKVSSRDLSLGRQARENIMVNSLAPFLFFYAQHLNKPDFKEKALELLMACSPEDNIKTRHFSAKSAQIQNAGNTQGLLQLFDQYCDKRQCLKCGIAAAVLKGR